MPKKIDHKSGSISYNRFEYQITQALNLAISLYDKYNYLIILEYYDDITLFENNNNIKDIHHYQVKTKDVQYIKFENILKERFLDNLIGHLNDNNINDVKEISLIINCNIEIDNEIYRESPIKPDNKNNILYKIKDYYKDNDKIDFLEKSMNLIISDIPLKNHTELIEARIKEFVSKKYQNAGYDALNSVVLRLENLFKKMQSDESLTNHSKFEDIKKTKGFSKEEFNEIMRMSIKVSTPEFSEIEKYVKFKENEIPQYKISYVDILETEYWNSAYNIKILKLIEEFIKNNKFNKKEETIIEYCKKCKTYISNNEYYLDSRDDNKHIELICMILMYNKHIKGI